MTLRPLVTVATAVALTAIAFPGRAQDTPKPEVAKATEAAAPRPRKRPALLRVEIAIARYQGGKRLASVPYTVLLTTDEKLVKLRMGVEVPIAVATFAKPDDSESAPITSFQYRNVGTNIDCRAEDRADDGLYQLLLNVENSSIYSSAESRTAGGMNETGLAPDRPLFRTFSVSLAPTLRDGQTVQAVASTDPVTGEVVKIDITLNVVR